MDWGADRFIANVRTEGWVRHHPFLTDFTVEKGDQTASGSLWFRPNEANAVRGTQVFGETGVWEHGKSGVEADSYIFGNFLHAAHTHLVCTHSAQTTGEQTEGR